MDVKPLILALVSIPIILLIGLTVFSNLATESRVGFEATVTNESLKDNATAGGTTITTLYAIKPNSETVYCGTGVFTNYTVNYYSEIDHSTITLGTNCGLAQTPSYANVSYTAYKGDGYSAYVSTYDNTIQANKLGSLLPYILIAITIVSVIIGAFGLSRIV